MFLNHVTLGTVVPFHVQFNGIGEREAYYMAAIGSTSLTKKPSGIGVLMFGDNDRWLPSADWANRNPVEFETDYATLNGLSSKLELTLILPP